MTGGGNGRGGQAAGRPCYAVIGTGAAAFGVLHSLLGGRSRPHITLIDIGRPAARPPDLGDDNPSELAGFYNDLYRQLFAGHRREFPPPKTRFGEGIPRYRLKSGDVLYKSESFGGLTNFWGSTMLPFTDTEMRRWPFGPDRLAPFYARIAELVGLGGQEDGLLQYFDCDFATRPPIRTHDALERLSRWINDREPVQDAGYRLISGVNRCGVETRVESERACVYCGECMAGCVKGSVFSAADGIKQMIADRQVDEVISGRVLAIDLSRRLVTIDTPSGKETLSGYSKIFLCAGCVGSTEILMRSLGMKSGPVMTDNAVYAFPIIYTGKKIRSNNSSYLALCNIILACIPTNGAERFAQIQVYPNFDYMWRFNMPPALWGALAPLVRASRSRIFWARLYVHSDLSQSYPLSLENDRLVLDNVPPPGAADRIKALMSAVRKSVRGNGFWVPPVAPIRQRTNSHYAGTLPFGGPLLDVPPTCEVGNGVYLCDSAVFPETPAVSLTFSLMANAGRIAWEATHG